VGGGALPLTDLEGPVVALAAVLDPVALLQRLRAHEPPVIARIHDGRVLVDPRTIADDEVDTVVGAVRRALAGG
jgi:L-seryl-tRNA(Ser) seleniumtransferase